MHLFGLGVTDSGLHSDNSTFGSMNATTEDGHDGFISYRSVGHVVGHFLILVLICIPALLLNGINIVVLVFSRKTSRTVKAPLMNIVLSNMVYLVGVSLYLLLFIGTVLAGSTSTQIGCKLSLLVYIWGASLRQFGLLVYGVTSFVTIKFKASRVRLWAVALACVGVWLLCLGWSLLVFVPGHGVTVHPDGTRCSLATNHSRDTSHLPFSFVYIHLDLLFTIISVFCLAFTCLLMLIALIHVKRNSFSVGGLLQKALLKFSVILIASNIINLLGIFFISSLSVSRRSTLTEDALSYYLPFTLLPLLSIVTPLTLMIVFKNLRSTLLQGLFGKCTCLPKSFTRKLVGEKSYEETEATYVTKSNDSMCRSTKVQESQN